MRSIVAVALIASLSFFIVTVDVPSSNGGETAVSTTDRQVIALGGETAWIDVVGGATAQASDGGESARIVLTGGETAYFVA